MSGIRWQALPATVALFVFFPGGVMAQTPYIYAHSSIVSVSSGVVNMWGYTEIDYATSYSYSAKTDVFGYQDSTLVSSNSASGGSWNAAATTVPATANHQYWLQTNHWVLSSSGVDPDGFGGISPPPAPWPSIVTLSATGTAGTGTSFYVATTAAATDTYGAAPSISGVDETSPGYGTAQPGTSGTVVLYGTGLTAPWADPSIATQVSLTPITTSFTYVGTTQVNLTYSIPAGTPPGPITGSLTTPYGTTSFNFTVNAPSGSGPTLSASPASGTGSSGSFTFTASGSGVSGMHVLIHNNVADKSHSCWMYFDGTTVSLANDDLSGWSGGASNSQCSITSVVPSPSITLSFTATIAFTTGFSGVKNVYVQASYGSGADTGYQTQGTWTVPSGSGGPTLSASPVNGTGSSHSFTFTAASASAVVSGMHVLFGNNLSDTSHSCWIYFDRSSGLWLANDDLSAWNNGASANSQCSVSSIFPSNTSTTLSFTANIAFTSSSGSKKEYIHLGSRTIAIEASSASGTGSLNVYVQASYGSGGDTGYLNQGTWTVP
jgi:hypothetical protein